MVKEREFDEILGVGGGGGGEEAGGGEEGAESSPPPPAPPTSPMGGGAGSAFGDVANQRSLLARLGKTRGNRPLGSGGYT